MNHLGVIVGVSSTSEVVLLNQQEEPVPYHLQDLFVIEDSQGNIYPIEVTDSIALKDFNEASVDGIIEGESSLNISGVDNSQPVYLAKARILKDLTAPIPPQALVRHANFEEIKDYIVFADVDNSFHLGVVKGTEGLHKELPEELQSVAPMWSSEKDTVIPQEGVPFLYDYKSLREYPHIGLFGSSGSGKSFGMHSILEEFMLKQIPGVILDPHNEGIFNRKMKGLPKENEEVFQDKYDVFKIGRNVGIPFSQLRVEDLFYLIEFVGDISDAQRSALDAIYDTGDTFTHLLNKMDYLKTAFDYYDSPAWGRQPKSAEEFVQQNPEASKLYEKVKKRVANVSVVDALRWRLEMLESTNVFDEKFGIHGVEASIRSGRMAIIQGSIKKLQMVSAYMIRTLYSKRRAYVDSKDGYDSQEEFFPPFIIGGDEFHNFAPSGYSNPTGRLIKEIAKEARKYGVYLVISTQRTTAIDEDVFAQLNTKFIYRLNTSVDIDLTSREANLSEEQTKQLPKLLRGHAFVVNPKIPRPMLMKFRTTLTEPSNIEDPFEELQKHLATTNTEVISILKVYVKRNPIRVTDIPRVILPLLKNELGRSVTFDETNEALNQMVKMGLVKASKTPIGIEYK